MNLLAANDCDLAGIGWPGAVLGVGVAFAVAFMSYAFCRWL